MSNDTEKRRSREEVDEKVSVSSQDDQLNTLGSLTPLNHSDSPFFVPDLTYTLEEERRVIRLLDIRLFPWVLLTTFVLNMDRTNISNAVSDNLPADLGFTIDTVNTATAVYAVLFTIFCFSGAVIAKIVGPQRCKLVDDLLPMTLTNLQGSLS